MLSGRTKLQGLVVITGAALITLIDAGCVYFHSSFFERVDSTEVCIDRFRLTPRIFAYIKKRGPYEQLKDHDFVVTIRVEDIDLHPTNSSWREAQGTIDSLAEAFLDSVQSVFRVDSLVFYPGRTDLERIRLSHNRDNFSPRRESFLTLKFGRIDLPTEISRLRAVLYATRPASGDSPPAADSAVWVMTRVETHVQGLPTFQESVRGYE